MSPLQRSMKVLRAEGWYVEKVEMWNAFSKTRKDLFNLLDLLCIRPDGKVLGVQVTTMGKKQPHIRKMQANKLLPYVLRAGWRIELHSWRKLKKTGWNNDIKIFD